MPVIPINPLNWVPPSLLQRNYVTCPGSHRPNRAGTAGDTQDCLGWEGPPDVLLAIGSFVQSNFLPQFPAPPRPAASTGHSFLLGGQRLDTVLGARVACMLQSSAP